MDGAKERKTVALTDTEILRAIEIGMLLLPEVPGRNRNLNIPGVMGRITNVPFPLTNMVGMAELTDENADETIQTVCAAYGDAPFAWLVGPLTTPKNLAERLQAAGFVLESGSNGMAGMVLRDLNVEIPPSPGVTVREMTPDDIPHLERVGSVGFGVPPEVGQWFGEVMNAPGALPSKAYLASVEGIEYPVGFGTSVYLDEWPILMLGGAAVVPEARGRGAYRALLAKRLADARAEGMEAAIIQAVRNTSAPICAKAGMIEVCDLKMWIKTPGGAPVTEA
jgi:GNAT superfamily N-acetyltransferase